MVCLGINLNKRYFIFFNGDIYEEKETGVKDVVCLGINLNKRYFIFFNGDIYEEKETGKNNRNHK